MEAERIETDIMLQNVLPGPVVQKIKAGQQLEADVFVEVTIMFLEICGFSDMARKMPPSELVKLLNDIYSAFDRALESYNVFKMETVGGTYMVVAGQLKHGNDNEDESVELARNSDVSEALDEKKRKAAEEIAHAALHLMSLSHSIGPGLHLRVGIHSGPAVGGLVGFQRPLYHLFGDTVNTASRMQSNGIIGKIHMSNVAAARLRRSFLLRERGDIPIKGKGIMRTYFLEGPKAEDERIARVANTLVSRPSVATSNASASQSVPNRLSLDGPIALVSEHELVQKREVPADVQAILDSLPQNMTGQVTRQSTRDSYRQSFRTRGYSLNVGTPVGAARSKPRSSFQMAMGLDDTDTQTESPVSVVSNDDGKGGKRNRRGSMSKRIIAMRQRTQSTDHLRSVLKKDKQDDKKRRKSGGSMESAAARVRSAMGGSIQNSPVGGGRLGALREHEEFHAPTTSPVEKRMSDPQSSSPPLDEPLLFHRRYGGGGGSNNAISLAGLSMSQSRLDQMFPQHEVEADVGTAELQHSISAKRFPGLLVGSSGGGGSGAALVISSSTDMEGEVRRQTIGASGYASVIVEEEEDGVESSVGVVRGGLDRSKVNGNQARSTATLSPAPSPGREAGRSTGAPVRREGEGEVLASKNLPPLPRARSGEGNAVSEVGQGGEGANSSTHGRRIGRSGTLIDVESVMSNSGEAG
eukprot:CAMPEP_0113896592 /NCGR_PEP_ID=MMETSP0780_2-20120614/18128_1 /TAXON_ID=652834 /ORGANISM="Palpitomonas bilix" /LENGTH=695 /DNA_ID=CAMNT_0000887799 /DNA_START=244 /DNA_END=2328 /DNA_ORIENTATION=- /assembly_acc=CAM_ASM_000599